MISSKIFRSRWSALIWSAGILWTAYDVASAAPQHPATSDNASNAAAPAQEDATGSPVDANDLAILAKFGGGN